MLKNQDQDFKNKPLNLVALFLAFSPQKQKIIMVIIDKKNIGKLLQ